jgi:peptidoglycan/LPS O-acetylase OafA/YrhL
MDRNLKTTNQTLVYCPQLDSLRAIAVILVIISHWFDSTHFLNRYTSNGSLGVTLFFVLSGFLITNILLGNKAKIEKGASLKDAFKVFYVRRSLRIFPIYYILLIFLLVFNIATIVISFWWHFFYLSNFYFYLQGQFGGALSHLWSLAVEEQFYLLWPALILLVPRKHLQSVFLIGIVLSVLFRFLIITAQNDIGRILLPGSIDSFCIGGLLIYGNTASLNWYKWYTSKKKYFLLIAFLLLIVVHLSIFKNLPFANAVYFLFISISFGIIIDTVANISKQSFISLLLQNKSIVFIGKISYGIYLFHNFIPYQYSINLSGKFSILNMYLSQGLRFLILLAVATCSWYFIEKPILKLKDRFVFNA